MLANTTIFTSTVVTKLEFDVVYVGLRHTNLSLSISNRPPCPPRILIIRWLCSEPRSYARGVLCSFPMVLTATVARWH